VTSYDVNILLRVYKEMTMSMREKHTK